MGCDRFGILAYVKSGGDGSYSYRNDCSSLATALIMSKSETNKIINRIEDKIEDISKENKQ